MALKGKIYTLAKQKEDLNAKELFLSMIQESINDDVVVIDGRNIAAGSVFASQIHADAITSEHIRSGAVTTDHMEAGSIDVDRLKAQQLILPGESYGGVYINNDGLRMDSQNLNVKLSSSTGFNITDRQGNQLIDIDPATGRMKLQVTELNIGGYKAATEELVEDRIRDIELTPGPTGPQGRGIVSRKTTFLNSTSGTTIPTGTWQNNPTPVKGQYLWEREVVTYDSGSPDTSYSVSYSALDGETGTPGTPGVGIDRDEVRYQVSASGTVIPTGSWLTAIPSVPKGQYLWTRTTLYYTSGTPTHTYTTSYQAKDGSCYFLIIKCGFVPVIEVC